MQAKLPDVNAVLVYYRTQSQKLMSQSNWLGASGALNSQNAVLPEDYRVVVDSRAYHEAVQTGTFYKCLRCSVEVPIQKIEFVKLFNNAIEKMFYKEDYSEHWRCVIDGCNSINRKSKSEKITTRRQEPFYLACVWEPPIKESGLATRFGFKQRFQVWFYRYQKELEHQIGKYRTEYQSQNPDEEIDDFKDTGED